MHTRQAPEPNIVIFLWQIQKICHTHTRAYLTQK